MSRTPGKTTEFRENRKRQILDTALSVYIRMGYYGTYMDAVAEEARLAKGLLYYYYRTKNELFSELCTWMFNKAHSLSDDLLENYKDKNPIEQLICYTYGVFCKNEEDPRAIQFSIRVPLDAYAIFGPEECEEGIEKSKIHRDVLASIIEEGVTEGLIPNVNPSDAANSFWAVFVANVFSHSKQLTLGSHTENSADEFRNIVRFCFQGLGIKYDLWNPCLEKLLSENQKQDPDCEEV